MRIDQQSRALEERGKPFPLAASFNHLFPHLTERLTHPPGGELPFGISELQFGFGLHAIIRACALTLGLPSILHEKKKRSGEINGSCVFFKGGSHTVQCSFLCERCSLTRTRSIPKLKKKSRLGSFWPRNYSDRTEDGLRILK